MYYIVAVIIALFLLQLAWQYIIKICHRHPR